ncbi:MAG: DUF2325 domain-containing protein [Rhodocyclales bacterium]|nr:DUF2325 domain-containing protein [Rhodocyclales bacterium]
MTPPPFAPKPAAAALARIAEATAGLPEPLAPAAAPPRRPRLWDLPGKYHCPIVGTCLDMDELARFARRFRFPTDPRDDYAVHVEAVGHTGSRNPVSEALHKHLERKYAGHVARFNRAGTDAEVLALWREHLAHGEVAGPLWAAMTHKAARDETRHAIYADVHMLSHQVGAGQAADVRRLAHLEAKNRELAQTLERAHREREHWEAELRARATALEAQAATLRAERAESQALRERLAAFESGTARVEMGRRLMSLSDANEQLRAVAERSRALEEQLRAERGKSLALTRERDELAAEREALERLMLAGSGPEEDCDGRCDSCDQAAKERCVLCVGGRTALVSQYRALAQRLGIRLVHHDGGLEESLSRLPDMINGADAVLCPTDCVSHAAYFKLKHHCKRTGKPCLLFKGAGVSGFALALTRLTAGQFSTGAPM